MTNKHMQKCLILLVIRKMLTKTTIKYHYIPTMVKIKGLTVG